MSSLPEASQDLHQLRADMAQFGYCLIERALDADLLIRVRERLLAQADCERKLRIDFTNPGHRDNQWVNMLLNKGQVFETLVLHPLASVMVADLLGEDYLLSCCDAQIKHAGSKAMPLHTDQWWMPPPTDPRRRHVPPSDIRRDSPGARDPSMAPGLIAPPAMCNVMWMVTDFSAQNGATVVVPGSHLSGQQPDGSLPHSLETVAAEGRAGTAIVFDGRLWHAAGANHTNETRYGITCVYCGPQFRPLENYTLGLRPEVLARCSKELLRRLGYRAWSTYGHTGDPDLDLALPGSETIGQLPN